MINSKYFYVWGLLFVLPLTILIYIKSNRAEKVKNVISGIGFGIMAFVFDYIFLDYWKPYYLIPNFHIEDLLYGFIFAGILPSVHNIVNKNHMKNTKFSIDIKLVILDILTLVFTFFIIVRLLKINYIYALSLTPLIVGIFSYIKVKGNVKDVLITMLFSLGITLVVYNLIILIYPQVIDNHFILDNI